MAEIAASPATVSTTAVTFRARQFNKLTIRVGKGTASVIYISTNGQPASATNANHVLYATTDAGDAVELDGHSVRNGENISIVATVAVPIFYNFD